MAVYFGIDIGTQGAKGVLCDATGRVLASSYIEQAFETPRPGWAEQDAEKAWWGSLTELTRSILDQAQMPVEEIAGIGISAFVPAMLMIDDLDRPLRPSILYTDQRAKRQTDWIIAQLESAGYDQQAYGAPDPGSPVPQLLWVREEEPSNYQRAARILQCHNYIVYRLTGQSVIDHAMKRSYLPLYDPDTDGWSSTMAELLGVDHHLLPERIDWASSLAGHVTQEAAEAAGLAAGTPVAVGTADSFADLIGAGVVQPGKAAALYSSFTTIMICQAEPEDRWHGYHCLPGLYFSGAAVPTGAVLTRWFRDQFGYSELMEAEASGKNAYELLDDLAGQAAPGSGGLVALPDFSGKSSSIHAQLQRGAFVGLSLSNTRAELYRALLEGIAYELRWQLIKAGPLPGVMAAAGGGSASREWVQIMSDILGIEQEVLSYPYSAPLGSAYLAGMAAGKFSDMDPLLTNWVQTQRTVRPRPEVREIYNQGFHIYSRARATFWPAG
jgi:xylulokinase